VARSTVLRLRGWWLNVHKWIGLCLAILIIPISITGAALVWDEPLDRLINPQRYDVTVISPRLLRVMTPGEVPPSVHERGARGVLGAGARIVSIRYPEGTGPIVVTAIDSSARAQSGPPPRVNVWLDQNQVIRSRDQTIRGRVLDTAPANTGLLRVAHDLHGNLMVPGWGRALVGWVGVFMFISCLTGIWLWWPIGGSFRRGFRWKRQNSTNANIHHLVGFWIMLPLAMLSFTGVWIAAPAMLGSQRPRPAPPQPLAQVRLSPDAALAAARASARGDRLTSITWPTDKAPEWKVAFAGAGEIAVDDATGVATAPRRDGPAGPQRPLMRRWHDGTGMGPVWQTIIFLGGLIPAILSITGLVMWWRSRGWKKALARKRKERALGAAAPQAAE
jgi:uncharacterized iron-regulated membrane protein